MKAIVTLGLGLALLTASAHSEEAKKGEKGFDAAKLVGNWKLVSGSKSGEKVDVKADSKDDFVFTKEDISIRENGTEMHKMSYKLDEKAKPVAITMTGLVGPAKDSTAEGIIELNGDVLKLCYALPGGKRPTMFDAPKDSNLHYFVFKRSK